MQELPKTVYCVYMLEHDDCYKRADTTAKQICVYTNKRSAYLHAINFNLEKMISEDENEIECLKNHIDDCIESDELLWKKCEKNIEYYNFTDIALEKIYNDIIDFQMDKEMAEFTMLPSFTAYIVEEVPLYAKYTHN